MTPSMYHPDKYSEHNLALKKFIRHFNKVSKHNGNELSMYFQTTENFREDGGIVHYPTNKKILYDFEKRFKYYESYGNFKFPTLGQFERKIKKPEIKLSIQCSTNEDGFLVAWHEDYYLESQETVGSVTADGSKESTPKRFTRDFREFSYQQFGDLYQVLRFAFKKDEFNKKSYSILD